MNTQEERGSMVAAPQEAQLPKSHTDARSIAEILVEMGKLVIERENMFNQQKYSADLSRRVYEKVEYQLKKALDEHAATTTELGKQYEVNKKLQEQYANLQRECAAENLFKMKEEAKVKDEKIRDLMQLLSEERLSHKVREALTLASLDEAKDRHQRAIGEWADIMEIKDNKIEKLTKAIDRLSAANVRLNKKLKAKK